jgi:glucose-1-phosphate adenylyltransferase
LAYALSSELSSRSHGAVASIIRNTFALVLAGGRGSRLKELTDRRAKPAVPFGGTARIIDFALSNAINSGMRRIGVATQYKAHSLIRHLQKGWTFLRSERNESFDILPASQRTSEGQWYQGTADAVYQNLDILERYPIEHIVVLAGDHVYKMDYAEMLIQHLDSRADVTVGCIEVPREEAVAFGVIRIDGHDRIENFIEKPNDPPAVPGVPDKALASMGIYVFDVAFLYDQLRRDAADPYSQHDFGRDIIPYIVQHGRAVAHRFSHSAIRSGESAEAYWRDVGTLDAFFEANLDLTNVLPALDLYDRRWPIWTTTEMLPPAKFVHDVDGRRGMAVSSLVANGCIVSGARVRRSLVSTGVRVNSWADIDGAVIMPYAEIGRGARLRNVIIDSDVRIPEGLVVGENPELDARRFRRTDKGVTLITQAMLDQLAS